MDTDTSEHVRFSLQEEVPEHILRTEDDSVSTDNDDNVEEDENSEVEEVDWDDNEFERGEGNPRWANAMSTILSTRKDRNKKTIVLTQATKIYDEKSSGVRNRETPEYGFEIEGEIKEEKPDPEKLKQEVEISKGSKTKKLKETLTYEVKQNRKKKIYPKEWSLKGRVKPNILDKNREKVLATVATKGIVQLFNTVRNHQKSINKKLGESGTIRKQEKVIKNVNKSSFLDMILMSSKGPKKSAAKEEEEDKDEEGGTWNVLRDDFMMGADIKDWDKSDSKLPDDLLKCEDEMSNVTKTKLF